MNTRAIEFIGAGATNYEGIPLLGLDILMLNNKFIYLCVSYCVCQNGLNLLGWKRILVFRGHLIPSISEQAGPDHLKWSSWTCLLIRVVTLHWVALAETAQNLQSVLAWSLLFHIRMILVLSKLDLLRLGCSCPNQVDALFWIRNSIKVWIFHFRSDAWSFR